MRGNLRPTSSIRLRLNRRSILLGAAVVALVVLIPTVASAVLTFSPRTSFEAGGRPGPVRASDFNGDGNTDLVVANWSANLVSVLLGDGAGSFGRPTPFAVEAYTLPYSVAVGDFNADGKKDLATANYNHVVSVLLGTGTGSFGAATNYPVSAGLFAIAVGDLNGDGKQDLAVAGSQSNDISVLLGNGDGTFETPTAFGVGDLPLDVAIGDLNGDGDNDLVAANADSNTVSVLINTGTPSLFGAATTLSVGAKPASVTIGDVNGDDKQDLAVTEYEAGTVSVLLGNGSGSFAARTSYGVGASPSDVEIYDFDSDGQKDLTVTNYDDDTVSILLGIGSGSFAAARNLAAGSDPNSLAVADYNNDGSPDLAVANIIDDGTVSILLNAPTADPDLTKLTFGSTGSPVRVGTLSPPLTVTLTNNGSAPLVVTGFEIGGAWPEDFVSQNSTCANRIAVGSHCTVKVRFAPNARGSRTATLTVRSNAAIAREIALVGIGRAAATGKLVSAKLSKKSFPAAQAGEVKLSCKFSPKSKIFRYVLALKKGKKWAVVKRVNKTGSFKTYKASVKKLFGGKRIKAGRYRLNLTADTNSKSLRFKIT